MLSFRTNHVERIIKLKCRLLWRGNIQPNSTFRTLNLWRNFTQPLWWYLLLVNQICTLCSLYFHSCFWRTYVFKTETGAKSKYSIEWQDAEVKLNTFTRSRMGNSKSCSRIFLVFYFIHKYKVTYSVLLVLRLLSKTILFPKLQLETNILPGVQTVTLNIAV